MALQVFPAQWLPGPYHLPCDRVNDTVGLDHLAREFALVP